MGSPLYPQRPIAISCVLRAISNWWTNGQMDQWMDQWTNICTNGPMDGLQTNQPTDGPTNGWTDKATYRVACMQLKNQLSKELVILVVFFVILGLWGGPLGWHMGDASSLKNDNVRQIKRTWQVIDIRWLFASLPLSITIQKFYNYHH